MLYGKTVASFEAGVVFAEESVLDVELDVFWSFAYLSLKVSPFNMNRLFHIHIVTTKKNKFDPNFFIFFTTFKKNFS